MGGMTDLFSSAGSAGQAAMNMGQSANTLNAIGGLTSAVGGMQQGLYQAQVARNNAAIEEANATQAIYANTLNESIEKTRTGIAIGHAKAAQGASGLDVGSGSPAAVREGARTQSAMDIAMMGFNAASQASALRSRASTLRAQAGLDTMAAANSLVGGVMKAGGSFLSGSASLASKWAAMQQSGVPLTDRFVPAMAMGKLDLDTTIPMPKF